MSAMVYENGAYKEAETPKVWNSSSNAFADSDGMLYDSTQQAFTKEAWSSIKLKCGVNGIPIYNGDYYVSNSLTYTNGKPTLNAIQSTQHKTTAYLVTEKAINLTNYSSITVTYDTAFVNIWDGLFCLTQQSNLAAITATDFIIIRATVMPSTGNPQYIFSDRANIGYNFNANNTNVSFTYNISSYSGNYYIIPIRVDCQDHYSGTSIVTVKNITLS